MSAFEDQRAVQQLLSGLNTMQMQAGLMPGQQPYTGHAATLEMYRQQQAQPSPADFSNHIRVQFHNAYAPQASMSPFHSAVTPVARNDFAQGIMPPPGLGMGWGIAQQQVQASQNQWMTGAQTGLGMGARLGMGGMSAWAGRGIGGAVGGMLGGPLGATAGAWLGGAAMPFVTDSLMGGAVENMAMLPFRGAIQQRQRSLALQNMSSGFLRTGPELHASGMGLSMTASMDLERNLSHMAGNRDFRRDTNNMFNRGDMMKITQLSGQLGMLDQSTNVDQITREVGKIGKALSAFMRIAEEPNVQQALQMMGRMKQLGMAVPEMSQAASNARTYARMAGVSVQGMLQEGMQGAMVFQQAGMSGATGLQTGMAAAGSASMLAGTLNPRQLAMLGGKEGIAQNLTAGAAQMANFDTLLPGLLKRGDKGTLEIDTDAMMKAASGQMDVNELIRKGAQRMADLGPNSMVQEFSTRRNELRDQMMNAYGGQGAVMAPLMLARSIERTGAMGMNGALSMVAGGNQQLARTWELANTPEYFRRMQQQREAQDFEKQIDMSRQRQQVYGAGDRARSRDVYNALADQHLPGIGQGATTFRSLGRGWNRFANARDDWFRAEFGEEQDAQEVQAMLGGGDMIGYNPAMRVSPTQVARSQAGLRDTRTAGRRYQGVRADQMEIAQRSATIDDDRTGRNRFMRGLNRQALFNPLMAPVAAGANLAVGAYDWAVSNPGTMAYEDVVMRHETWQNRALDTVGLVGGSAFGGAESAEDRKRRISERGQSMERGARIIEAGLNGRYDSAKVTAVQRSAGFGDNDRAGFEDIRARLGASLVNYARTKAGWGPLGNTEGFDEREMRSQMIDELMRDKDMTREQAAGYANNDALVSEALRLVSPGLDDKTKAQLTAGMAAGGDSAGKRGTELGRATADVLAERTNKFIGNLGMYSGDLDSGQQKQLMSLFSGEGKEADARRKLFQARSLELLGGGDNVRRAALLRGEAESLGLKPDQYAEAESEVRGFTESVDADVMRAAGRDLSKNWKTRGAYAERGREGAEGVSATAQAAAFEEKFGKEAADVFREARARGASGAGALRAFQKGGGKIKASGWTSPNDPFTKEQRAAFDAGKLTDEDLEGIAKEGIQYRVKPLVENANSVGAGQAVPETVESRMGDVLAQQAQQQTQAMSASFSKFDGTVDKLSDAAKLLADAGSAIAGSRERQNMDRNVGSSQTLAKNNALSQ